MRLLLIFLLLTGPVFAKTSDYATLVERAKQSDPELDFSALRKAYTETPTYSGYAISERGPMVKAVNKSDWAAAKKEAHLLLDQCYLDLEAHYVLLMVAEEEKDVEAAAHHEYMLRGLLVAIRGARDGKSAKTAWPVLNVGEEYAVCRLLGLKVKNRGLVTDESGSYDAMDVVDRDGKEFTIYFDVSSFFGKLDL